MIPYTINADRIVKFTKHFLELELNEIYIKQEQLYYYIVLNIVLVKYVVKFKNCDLEIKVIVFF